MNLRRVGILFGREVAYGPKNFMFTFAIVVPLLLTLVISLAFGTVFSGKPRLGVMDAGDSVITRRVREMNSVILKEYDTVDEVREATERGAVDVSLVMPADFDEKLLAGDTTHLDVFVWGESMLKNRAAVIVILGNILHEFVGEEAPVDIITQTVGDDPGIPWNQRLLPMIVLMTVVIGGFMVPASSLVEEKMKRTLKALSTTPATLGEIFASKALLGVLLSLFMGIVILLLNRAFGVQPGLLVLLLILGALLSAVGGLLLGAVTKDITALFATVKSLGILLYAPALLYMFPGIPQWIGYFFPTYYMINPVMEVSINGAGWSQIAWQVFVLIGIIAAGIAALGVVGQRMQMKEL